MSGPAYLFGFDYRVNYTLPQVSDVGTGGKARIT
jgi:hypothetical protein